MPRVLERGSSYDANRRRLHNAGNSSRDSRTQNVLPLGLPFATVAATPEELPSPSHVDPGGTIVNRRVDQLFRQALSAGVTNSAARVESDDVGLSPVSVVSHCAPVKPPGTQESRPPSPHTGERRFPSRASDRLRSLTPLSGRNAIPLRAILTWPLHRHSLPSDPGYVPLRLFGSPERTSLVMESSSEDFRTGADPPG